jgi:hypothetical protein
MPSTRLHVHTITLAHAAVCGANITLFCILHVHRSVVCSHWLCAGDNHWLYTCAVMPSLHLSGSADVVSFLCLEMHGVHGASHVVSLCCSKFRSRTALVFRFLSFFVLNFWTFQLLEKFMLKHAIPALCHPPTLPSAGVELSRAPTNSEDFGFFCYNRSWHSHHAKAAIKIFRCGGRGGCQKKRLGLTPFQKALWLVSTCTVVLNTAFARHEIFNRVFVGLELLCWGLFGGGACIAKTAWTPHSPRFASPRVARAQKRGSHRRRPRPTCRLSLRQIRKRHTG